MEKVESALQRWDKLHALQRHYEHFIDFLRDGMEHLGFNTSDIQEDIGAYLEFGPESLMVQAQRSQAKTTIAALFAVWSLIHSPKARVLIISAGGRQANEISTLVVRVIMTMDELECMRPDKQAGDRTSVEAFDVHHSLKGVDKSPSVACMGITANLQGARADILIADDIESTKNGLTALQRAQLLHLTLDFVSICREGRIIWLGTPQTSDSIYNSLPGRGVAVRIWPGRYPTPDQRSHYGDMLAPLLVKRMAADPTLCSGGGILGDQGKPIDSLLMPERSLQTKELDQGTAYFQLQHMLSTKLTDAMRHPLKTSRILVMRLLKNKMVPIEVTPGLSAENLRTFAAGTFAFQLNTPAATSPIQAPLTSVVMYVDPAPGGVNADETGYAIVGMLNGNVFVLDVGGVPGGYDIDKMEALAAIAKEWQVNCMLIEKNMGFGAFREVFLPVLRKVHTCEVQDDYVVGQKELRILATLEPVIGRGSLIINEDIIDADWEKASRYGSKLALTYSFFYQLSKLTRDRNSLAHDDRLDALEGAVRHFQAALALDQKVAQARAEEQAWKAMMKDPLGRQRYTPPKPRGGSLLTRFKRK